MSTSDPLLGRWPELGVDDAQAGACVYGRSTAAATGRKLRRIAYYFHDWNARPRGSYHILLIRR